MYLKPNHTRNRLAYYILFLMALYAGISFFLFMVLSLNGFEFWEWLGMDLRYGGKRWIGEALGVSVTIQGVMEVTLLVVFAMWMARASSNLINLGIKTRYGPFSAAFCWFIPVGQFWMPFQAIKEIINKYTSFLRFFNEHRDVDIVDRGKILNTTSLWWGLWVFLWPFSFGFGAYFVSIMDTSFHWDEKWQFLLVAIKIGIELILILQTMKLLKQIGSLESQAYQLWDTGQVDRLRLEKERNSSGEPTQEDSNQDAESKLPDWLNPEEAEPSYAEENLFDA